MTTERFDSADRDHLRADHAQALCRAVSELHARGLCIGTSGNFSITLSHDPLRVLVTKSGHDKAKLDPLSDLVAIDGNGAALEPGGQQSAEAKVHGVIARVAKAGSILHTHSVYGTLLGMHFVARGGFRIRGYEMQKGLEGVRSHEDDVFVPVVPNTQDMDALAHTTEELIKSHPDLRGFLIAGHGLYAWGRTLGEAKRHIEVFEFLFELVGRRTAFEPFAG